MVVAFCDHQKVNYMISISTTTLSSLNQLDTLPEHSCAIVWGNTDADFKFVKHLNTNICFIPAHDVDDYQLSFTERIFADYLPNRLSLVLTNSKLGKLIRHTNYPWHPPLDSDIKKIILFVNEQLANGCTNFVIACEHGRSRSVATAHFLKHKLGAKYVNERIGNVRIRRLFGHHWSSLAIHNVGRATLST